MANPFRVILSLCALLMCAGISAQTTDASGRKQGYWKKKDPSGKLLYEGEFKDNKPVGKFKYYYPNDSVKAILNFKNNGTYAQLFHMNGKKMAQGKYVGAEIKDSLWSYFDESGKLLSKDNYKAGKKNGLCLVFLPDGKISEEKNYKEDVLQGEFKEYFDGVNLRSKGTYSDGKLEGRTVYYYPNGTEVAAGFHRNGLKTGPWIYRTESGKVREKELYRNGVLASPKETEEFFAKNKEQSAPSPTTAPAPQKKPVNTPKKTK
jgi:antitoxin component YwqK of YwqJK toxin-antitoxin module